MKDEFDYRYEILLKEMETLQANIRGFNQILFRIKGWAVTVFSGFIFFGVKESEPILFFVGSMSVILFWVLDAIYKKFQRKFIVRHNRIEHFLRTDEFSKALEKRSFHGFHIPDFSGRFSVKNHTEKTTIKKAAFYWHTSLLYIAMLLLSMLVAGFMYIKA